MADSDEDVQFLSVISIGNAQTSTVQNHSFGCSTCSGHFATVHDFKKHRCPHIGWTSECQSNMKTKRHKGSLKPLKKPFVCQLCHKAFKSKKGCIGHFLVHINTRFCMCPHCGQPFCQIGLLPKYKVRVLQNSIKKDLCGYCGKTRSEAVHLPKEIQQGITVQEQNVPTAESPTNPDQSDSVCVNNQVSAIVEDAFTQQTNVKQKVFQERVTVNNEEISVLAQHNDSTDEVMEVDTPTQCMEVKQVVLQEQDSSSAEDSSILVKHGVIRGNSEIGEVADRGHANIKQKEIKQEVIPQEQDTRRTEKVSNNEPQIIAGETEDVVEDALHSFSSDFNSDGSTICSDSVVHFMGRVVGKRLFVCNLCGKEFAALPALKGHQQSLCQGKLYVDQENRNISMETSVVANETSENNKSSIDKTVLQQEAESVTTKTVQRLLCHICGRVFTEAHALSKHECSQKVAPRGSDTFRVEKQSTLIQQAVITIVENEKESGSVEDSLELCAEVKQDVSSEEQDTSLIRMEKLPDVAQQCVLVENDSREANTYKESGFSDSSSKIAKPTCGDNVEHLKDKAVVENLFVCNPCGEEFTAISALKAHRHLPCRGKFHFDSNRKTTSIKANKDAKETSESGESSVEQTAPRQESTGTSTELNVFVCNPCGGEFTEVKALNEHKCSEESSRAAFTCCKCGNAFRSEGSLVNHLGYLHGERLWCCSKCGRRFRRRRNMLIHKRRHSDLPVGSNASSSSHVLPNFHLAPNSPQDQTAKPSSPVDTSECTNDNNDIAQHKTNQIDMWRLYSCKLCGEGFPRVSDLQKHTNCSGKYGHKAKRACCSQKVGKKRRKKGHKSKKKSKSDKKTSDANTSKVSDKEPQKGKRSLKESKVEDNRKNKRRKRKRKTKVGKECSIDTDASKVSDKEQVKGLCPLKESQNCILPQNSVGSETMDSAQMQKSCSFVYAHRRKAPKHSPNRPIALRAIAPKPISPTSTVQAFQLSPPNLSPNQLPSNL